MGTKSSRIAAFTQSQDDEYLESTIKPIVSVQSQNDGKKIEKHISNEVKEENVIVEQPKEEEVALTQLEEVVVVEEKKEEPVIQIQEEKKTNLFALPKTEKKATIVFGDAKKED